MARIPGRSAWLAWPVGMLCAAVVAALVWLALPMTPVVVTWLGETLRAATSQPAAAPTGSVPVRELAEAGDPLDCRTLYPADLWMELAWRPQGMLDQDFAPPATSAAALTEALAPEVRLTCRWRFGDGTTISTTLARVGDDAETVAAAALRAAGFACATTADSVLRCERSRGRVVEEHAVTGGLWLSSVEAGEPPAGYGTRLAETVFG